jgi:hypothetical protein
MVDKLKTIFYKIKTQFLDEMNIGLVISIPVLLGLAIMAFGGIFGFQIIGNSESYVYRDLIGGVGCFVASFSGIFQIIRKESPGMMGKVVTGKWAIATGIFWTVFWLIGSVLLIWFSLFGNS